jgi:hypothetical protein
MLVRAFARSRRRVVMAVGTAAVVLGASLAINHAMANAATFSTATAALPLESAADVVATGDRVFISGGVDGDQIAITDPTGRPAGSITGLAGPTDLLLSADLATLYVALPNVNAIAAFDTTSLQQTAWYPTGSGTCPRSLALSGRWLWFGYACDVNSWNGNVGRVDLGAAPATVRTALVGGIAVFYGAPLVDSPPSGSVLVVGQPSLSPGSLQTFAVGTDGSLTRLLTSVHGTVGGNLRDIAVTSDASTVFTASGAPYSIVGYGVADLTQQLSLPTTAYPNAIELSADNKLVAGGSDAYYDNDVFVFRRNGTRVGSVDFGTGNTLVDRSLAWAPDGTRLYAVTENEYAYPPQPPTLHVLLVSA